VLRVLVYDNQTSNLEEMTDPKQVLTAISDTQKTIWVDLTKPSQEEAKLLEEGFHFHTIAVESALKEGERPKFYSYGNYSFLLMEATIASNKGSVVKLSQFSAFISKNYLVTVHQKDVNFIEDTINTIKSEPNYSIGVSVFCFTTCLMDS